jgi:nucleoside-diphosphate-sugar epimerase
MKILITGKSGYIAKSLYNNFKSQYDIISVGREDFNLTNFKETNSYFNKKYFDVIIHTAVSGGYRLKKDTFKDMDNNLLMYYNLLQHNLHYGKLIHLGSGAEIYNNEEPYGLSKKIIYKSIQEIDNFYSLRLFGLFDENENQERFIKSNITRNINNESLIIYNNRKMDFFYMKDFFKVIDFYLNDKNSPKEMDCVYKEKYTLHEIAKIINRNSNNPTNIIFKSDINDSDYCGNFIELNLKYDGLEYGISETYKNIKSKLFI